jgi:hypothetical protein
VPDLLDIEIDYNENGSITLHQTKYVEKLVKRFLPDGPSPKVQRNTLPYSSSFLEHLNQGLAQTECEYPELVRPMQERIGCLMYAATSTRCDIAYTVNQLCQCMHKPTPAVMAEVDHLISYLARHPRVGLTYSPGFGDPQRLAGFADASWETRRSTSGWVMRAQCAALSWGSPKQKSTALSSCEAEIIALSEATKDAVYLRKVWRGLREPDADSPTRLATDSQSARDVSYNPEQHGRMKHVARRHFFVRDMVESLEIEVPYVRTADNDADFFTKPMKSAPQFFAFRAKIMNEPERPGWDRATRGLGHPAEGGRPRVQRSTSPPSGSE